MLVLQWSFDCEITYNNITCMFQYDDDNVELPFFVPIEANTTTDLQKHLLAVMITCTCTHACTVEYLYCGHHWDRLNIEVS